MATKHSVLIFMVTKKLGPMGMTSQITLLILWGN